MFAEILGVLTGIMGIIMSLGHFAQARKLYQRKSSKDVSLITYSTFAVGSYVWLAYGIAIMQWPIIASFTIAVLGTTLVLILIVKYR